MDKIKASKFWDASRNGLFDFAAEIADGSQVDIAQLAAEKHRTPSLFYGYKKAGQLWLAILKRYPAQAEELRAELEIGFWTPLARLWSSNAMTLEETRQALVFCIANRKAKSITVDSFREQAQADAETKTRSRIPDWKREAKDIAKKYIHTTFWNTEQSDVAKIQRAAKLLQGRILAATEKAEESN